MYGKKVWNSRGLKLPPPPLTTPLILKVLDLNKFDFISFDLNNLNRIFWKKYLFKSTTLCIVNVLVLKFSFLLSVSLGISRKNYSSYDLNYFNVEQPKWHFLGLFLLQKLFCDTFSHSCSTLGYLQKKLKKSKINLVTKKLYSSKLRKNSFSWLKDLNLCIWLTLIWFIYLFGLTNDKIKLWTSLKLIKEFKKLGPKPFGKDH